MATAVKTETVTLTLTPVEASLIRRALFLYGVDHHDGAADLVSPDQIRTVISEAISPF